MKNLFRTVTPPLRHRLLLKFYSGELLCGRGHLDEAAVVDAHQLRHGSSVCYSPETCKCGTSSHNFVQFADWNRTEDEYLAVAMFVNWDGRAFPDLEKNDGMCPRHLSQHDAPEFLDMPQAFLAIPIAPMSWPSTSQYWGCSTCFQPRGLGLRGRYHLHRRRARADRSGDQRRYQRPVTSGRFRSRRQERLPLLPSCMKLT